MQFALPKVQLASWGELSPFVIKIISEAIKLEEQTYRERVVSRLDMIIRLLLARSGSHETPTKTDMISQLKEMGLTPSEIGSILGKPANYVSAALSQRKRTVRAKRH